MKQLARTVLVIAAVSLSFAPRPLAREYEYPTNLVAHIEALNAEVDLGQLLDNTNTQAYSWLDEQVCRSLPAKPSGPKLVSYRLISFIFHHLSANGPFESSCETTFPDSLLFLGGKITRTNAPGAAAPINYVRVADANAKQLTAEVDLLIEVKSLNKPYSTQYLRRSFWYVRNNDKQWNQDASPRSR